MIRVDFGLASESLVPCRSSKSPSSVVKDGGSVGFGEEEKHCDENCTTQKREKPDRPAPAHCRCQVPADDRSKNRTKNTCRLPEDKEVGHLCWWVYVVDSTAASRQTRTTTEAGYESEDQKDGDIWGEADRDLEYYEGKKGPEEDLGTS